MNVNEIITENRILSQYYILRHGYEFKPLTHPANIYDALVIKKPPTATCVYPKIVMTGQTLSEQIDFVNENKLEKAIIVANNISFLANCPTLKHLIIIPENGSEDNFDFSPLYKIPEVKTLNCRTVYGVHEELSGQVDYSKINGIESLGISGKGHINFNRIETLKTLGVSNYTGVDLTDMFSSKKLDTIRLIRCKTKSLDGIQQSDNMQCLYLHYNRYLQDISALKETQKSLKALRIENCPSINDFSVLEELEKLELLELSGSNKLPDLSFLLKMKNLKTFILNMDVNDGDLSPCLDLSYVYSAKNRKHYNLKNTELPKGKYVRGNETIEMWRRFE